MWSARTLARLDFRVLPVIFSLMVISLLVISAHSVVGEEDAFATPMVRSQLQWFAIGLGLYFFCAAFDYNKLREWTWLFYALMILSLVGLFFTDSIQRVNRWYRIPLLGMSIQPSEHAKLVVVIALSWLLERRQGAAEQWSTVFLTALTVGIPFLLILKQPDLGTALVLFPITLVMCYFGNLRSSVIKGMTWVGGCALLLVALIFLGIIPHESLRPTATLFLKNYQFDRLNPATHHQKAAAIAIALGGFSGSGWRKSEFSGRGWLPAPYTDSVFPAFGEEFGLLGLSLLMVLYYALIYFSFQVTAVAKDSFGRLLSAGITVYLAMHILVNIGMMCGFLPITGVPLVLVTYGGSSILVTMMALGLLQSVYSRRFMF
jgi:rod shape determining protein RodA